MKNHRKYCLIFTALFFCKISTAQTTLTLLNSYNIGSNVDEPSGLAFDKVNNQLFTVSDSDNIYRMSVTGSILDTYTFPGDLEGVSMYNANNTLLIAIEDTFELVEFNYVTESSIFYRKIL